MSTRRNFSGWIAKYVTLAVGVGFPAVPVLAADLPAPTLSDPLPDTLTYKGFTLYGLVDIGVGHQTSGAPINSAAYWGMNYNVWAAPAGRSPITSFTANAVDVSMIGLKFEEKIFGDWKVIGKLETGLNPLNGRLDDACASIVENNGKPSSQQTVNFDGSRCGQFLNGSLYAGISNPTYGTLTFGRQNSLSFGTLLNYDPTELSFAFSLLGWSGGFGGGSGATEALRWDNSLKYTYQYGPMHAGLMFAEGAQGSALHGDSYAGNIGATWHGFSIDAVYTAQRDAVTAFAYGAGACNAPGMPSCNTLGVTAQNDDAWLLAAKYVYEFGGAMKGAKLTFYGGYEHIRNSDPSNPLSVGDTTIGGYVIGAVDNTAYLYGSQNRNIAWVGARYETGPWSFAAGYYRAGQDFFKVAADSVPCSSSASYNCSGNINTVSALVDYSFNKHLDVYAGIMWSNLTGGFASGYTTTENTTLVTGAKLSF
jgi:predicted porin